MYEEDLPADVEEVAKDHHFDDEMVTEDQIAEKMKATYPKGEECNALVVILLFLVDFKYFI